MSKKIKLMIMIAIILIFALVLFLFLKNKTYVVTFDTDGGTKIDSVEVKKGETVSKPTDPLKEDYLFLNWTYNGQEYDFSNPIKDNMTLKARWQEVQMYNLTFNVEGNVKTIRVSKAEKINIDSLGYEERDGYQINWYLNGKDYDIRTPLTEDLSLEGKYEKIVYYTVKFNANGGTSVDNVTVKRKDYVTEPVNVIKEGYLLDGWYLNNKKYDFNTMVNDNMTLTAKWSEDPSINRYIVKFESNGGTSVASQRIMENKKVTKPKDPTKENYIFEGWYVTSTTKYDFNKPVTSNLTLYAAWREEQGFSVMFDTNGGSKIPNVNVYIGRLVARPEDPIKDGYQFDGWLLNGQIFDFNTPIKEDTILKAKWIKKYTVTFDTDGGNKIDDQIVLDGGKVVKPTDPIKEGCTFKEWQLNNSEYNFDNNVTSNINLKAIWEVLNQDNEE